MRSCPVETRWLIRRRTVGSETPSSRAIALLERRPFFCSIAMIPRSTGSRPRLVSAGSRWAGRGLFSATTSALLDRAEVPRTPAPVLDPPGEEGALEHLTRLLAEAPAD